MGSEHYESHPDQDAILNAIAPIIDGVITAYVVLAEVIRNDGGRAIYSATMDDQRSHITLGLLAYGDAIERSHAIRHFWSEDE